MRVDLHNHTYRCNHAQGTPESYVLEAIKQNINVFGFSCHNPMDYDKKFRMSYEEFKDYCDDILILKEKYQDQIEILLALEMDFMSNQMHLIKKELFKAPLDYLIGSVHFLDDWGFDNPEFIGEYKKRNMIECWNEYLDCIAKMAQSGLFQIIGHFDLLKVFNQQPPDITINKIEEVLGIIAQSKIALEINASGLRKPIGEQYPSQSILDMAYQLGVKIAFGSDAHHQEHVGYGYHTCIEVAKKAGYKQAVFFRKKQEICYEF